MTYTGHRVNEVVAAVPDPKATLGSLKLISTVWNPLVAPRVAASLADYD
jgi:hypothetical protein